MAKKTVVTQTSAGEFTRKTDVAYTHAVVRTSPRAAAVFARFQAGEYKGSRSGVDAGWIKDRGYAVTWHRSEAAAKDAASKSYAWDFSTTVIGIFAAGVEGEGRDPAPGEWVPADADEVARANAEEMAKCRAAGPTALHRMVRD